MIDDNPIEDEESDSGSDSDVSRGTFVVLLSII